MRRILNAIAELIEARAELMREEAATVGLRTTRVHTKKAKTIYSKVPRLSTQQNHLTKTDLGQTTVNG